MSKVTQMQIAIKADVDRTTVSKIINGYQLDQFSPDVVNHVKSIALELGYKFNKRKDALNIGLIFPLPSGTLKIYSNSFRILEAIMGISDALKGTCHSFHIVNYDDNIKQVIGQSDAYLIWETPSTSILKKMDASNINYIVLNRVSIDYTGSYVIHDDMKAFAMAAEHLISANHKNIALIADQPNEQVKTYFLTISAILKKSNLNFPDSNLLFLTEGNNEDILKNLEKNKITGIIASNDIVGYRVMEIINRSGKKIPDDYSIVTNNYIDTCYSNLLKPTGIKTPWYELAKRGAELLISRMKRTSSFKSTIHEVIDPKIIIGNTVKSI